MKVSISLSDPWDLGESLGWALLSGTVLRVIEDENGGRALIKLDTPISYRDSQWRYVRATPRFVDVNMLGLKFGVKLPCGLVGVTEEQAETGDSWKTSPYSKLSFIADVERIL